MNQNDWAQLRELRDLQERMNRFFHESRARDAAPAGEWTQEGEWAPATDIYEHDGEIVLKMDLPDIDQREIKLTIDGNRLLISGERKLNPEIQRDRYVRIERPYGQFSRSFALPETVDHERIEAVCEAGVLKVRLPRRSEKQARVINIEVK